MSEEQNLRPCPRCESQNPIQHNFCWLCGLALNQQQPLHEHPAQAPPRSNKTAIAASVGTGIFGALAGVMGGIAIGAMIVLAVVSALINSFFEALDGCGAMLVFMSLAASATFYSILSWFF